jgi:hypothetical protein
MVMTARQTSCACGRVRFQAMGEPIMSAVCYCDDCQKGALPIEALPNAPSFREADGGTPYLTYRDDRFKCLAGEDLLVDYKLTEQAPTRRVVASCCNSALFLKFGPGHWVSAYRTRFEGEPPAVQMRMQTKFRQADEPLPGDVPSYPGFGTKLFPKLIAARLAMLLGR